MAEAESVERTNQRVTDKNGSNTFKVTVTDSSKSQLTASENLTIKVAQ